MYKSTFKIEPYEYELEYDEDFDLSEVWISIDNELEADIRAEVRQNDNHIYVEGHYGTVVDIKPGYKLDDSSKWVVLYLEKENSDGRE